jgi:hypothetical protein
MRRIHSPQRHTPSTSGRTRLESRMRRVRDGNDPQPAFPVRDVGTISDYSHVATSRRVSVSDFHWMGGVRYRDNTQPQVPVRDKDVVRHQDRIVSVARRVAAADQSDFERISGHRDADHQQAKTDCEQKCSHCCYLPRVQDLPNENREPRDSLVEILDQHRVLSTGLRTAAKAGDALPNPRRVGRGRASVLIA